MNSLDDQEPNDLSINESELLVKMGVQKLEFEAETQFILSPEQESLPSESSLGKRADPDEAHISIEKISEMSIQLKAHLQTLAEQPLESQPLPPQKGQYKKYYGQNQYNSQESYGQDNSSGQEFQMAGAARKSSVQRKGKSNEQRNYNDRSEAPVERKKIVLKYTSDAEVTDEKLKEILISKDKYINTLKLLTPKLPAHELYTFKGTFYNDGRGVSGSLSDDEDLSKDIRERYEKFKEELKNKKPVEMEPEAEREMLRSLDNMMEIENEMFVDEDDYLSSNNHPFSQLLKTTMEPPENQSIDQDIERQANDYIPFEEMDPHEQERQQRKQQMERQRMELLQNMAAMQKEKDLKFK